MERETSHAPCRAARQPEGDTQNQISYQYTIAMPTNKLPRSKPSRGLAAIVSLLALAQIFACGGCQDGRKAQTGPAAFRSASVEELKDQVVLAIKQHDRDKLLGLYCWDGTDEDLLAQTEGTICRMLLDKKVVEAYVEEASPDDAPYSGNGPHLVWTAPVTHHVVLRPAKTNEHMQEVSTTLYAGQADGRWCLVGVRRGRPGEPQPTAVIEKYTGQAANPRPEGGHEKYEAIKHGMSRDKAFEILGNVMVRKLQKTGGSQEAYEWEYRRGTITVGFSDGLVDWKANSLDNE